jgi:hypothetical protein
MPGVFERRTRRLIRATMSARTYISRARARAPAVLLMSQIATSGIIDRPASEQARRQFPATDPRISIRFFMPAASAKTRHLASLASDYVRTRRRGGVKRRRSVAVNRITDTPILSGPRWQLAKIPFSRCAENTCGRARARERERQKADRSARESRSAARGMKAFPCRREEKHFYPRMFAR